MGTGKKSIWRESWEILAEKPLQGAIKASKEIVVKTIEGAFTVFNPLEVWSTAHKNEQKEKEAGAEQGKDKNFTPLDTKTLYKRMQGQQQSFQVQQHREAQRRAQQEEYAKRQEQQKAQQQAPSVMNTRKTKRKLGQKRQRASSDQMEQTQTGKK